MPSRNIVRIDMPESYYHVYVRGINRSAVFQSPEQKEYVLYLLSRHLSLSQETTRAGYRYPHYRGSVELLSYCVMDNHLHFLLYQKEQGAIAALMKSVTGAYAAFYNKNEARTGPVFESRYKSALISSDGYFEHVSRYIHLNPRNWKYYEYSSLGHIRRGSEPEWLQTKRILEAYSSRLQYVEFVQDYEETNKMKKELEKQLADSP